MTTFLFAIVMQIQASVGVLPGWVAQKAKLQTIDQLTEWSSELSPYKLSSIVSTEKEGHGGDRVQNIEISLMDEKCPQRKMTSVCLPVGLHTKSPALFCNFTLDGCSGKALSKALLVK